MRRRVGRSNQIGYGNRKTKQPQDAGAPEIDVTPEMTLAGDLVLSAADTRVEDTQEMAITQELTKIVGPR